MDLRVTVVGGTGFIGTRLVAQLLARGALTRIVSRRAPKLTAPARQVEHLTGDIQDDSIIDDAVDGVDAVVNLIGTTAAKTGQQFFSLHRDVPNRLAQAARRAGVRRFVHVSAMGVRIDAPSMADRSKAEGEQAVREIFPGAILVRPALVYGQGDHFFTRFAPLVRRSPVIPLIGGGRTRFQPMHVDDVVEAMANILEHPATAGRTYELGAEEIFSFRNLIELLCKVLGRRPRLVPIPFPLAELGAHLTQWLPHAPLTVDQVRLLKTDKVMGGAQYGPIALGIRPRPLEFFLSELREVFKH